MEKTSQIISSLLLLAVCLILFTTTAGPKDETTIFPKGIELREGDLVFRLGRSMASHAITTADHNGNYSHVGIVVDSSGFLRIIHAIPNEHDFPGDVDRVKIDRPEIFFMSSRAKIGEVMRPRNHQQAHIAAETALRIYQRHTLFDHDYDATDSTKMYCTELVLYAYDSAGLNLATGPLQKITFPISFEGYFPSDIHASPQLSSICVFQEF